MLLETQEMREYQKITRVNSRKDNQKNAYALWNHIYTGTHGESWESRSVSLSASWSNNQVRAEATFGDTCDQNGRSNGREAEEALRGSLNIETTWVKKRSI